jgi:hypothetical protein
MRRERLKVWTIGSVGALGLLVSVTTALAATPVVVTAVVLTPTNTQG